MKKKSEHGVIDRSQNGKNDAWIPCPYCNEPLLHVYPDSKCEHVGAVCKYCGNESDVTVTIRPQKAGERLA